MDDLQAQNASQKLAYCLFPIYRFLNWSPELFLAISELEFHNVTFLFNFKLMYMFISQLKYKKEEENKTRQTSHNTSQNYLTSQFD